MKRTLLTLLIGMILQVSLGQVELKDAFEKAVKLLQSEKYQNSAELFTEILDKATDDRLLKYSYLYRAFSYSGLGEYEKAIADLDKAIELDPTDLASYTDRGKVKIKLNDLQSAKNDFEFILTIDSIGEQGEAALYYLGDIAYQLGQYEESITYYDKLIILAPKDYEAFFNRAVDKGLIMDFEGAILDYSHAIKIKPDYSEAYANRGVVKINMLTAKGNIHPTLEQTEDGCTDLLKAKKMGDQTVEDLILIYCNKK